MIPAYSVVQSLPLLLFLIIKIVIYMCMYVHIHTHMKMFLINIIVRSFVQPSQTLLILLPQNIDYFNHSYCKYFI